MTNQKHIKVAAFTGRPNDPASYFRIRQYIKFLQQQGLTIQEFSHPSKGRCWYPGFLKAIPYISAVSDCRTSNVVLLSRVLVTGYETFESLLKRPRVMDVDDAIWLTPPFGKYTVPHIAKGMDAIIAGNQFLADWFSKYCRKIYIVPTAIDLERYRARPVAPAGDTFIIGWTGTSSNFKYLRIIEKPLMRFLRDHPDAQLKIIADCRWQSDVIPQEKITFVPWSRNIEVSALYDMSVGIMPLEDNDWTRGKCSFKMLQYMAVGLPVVISPVGMNVEVLAKGKIGLPADSDNEWYEALETLYKDNSLQRALGQTGRKVIEQYYNANMVAHKLCSILTGMAR
jgi:glycosyltransferase involved in cell wall biosynthesis